jgi:tetratricopeptide (TPR) repeat protein
MSSERGASAPLPEGSLGLLKKAVASFVAWAGASLVTGLAITLGASHISSVMLLVVLVPPLFVVTARIVSHRHSKRREPSPRTFLWSPTALPRIFRRVLAAPCEMMSMRPVPEQNPNRPEASLADLEEVAHDPSTASRMAQESEELRSRLVGPMPSEVSDRQNALSLLQDIAATRASGDRRAEGIALGNLGNAHAALGKTRQAIELYEQQLAIAREIGDRQSEGIAFGNLGNAYAALGEKRRPITLNEQFLAIARETGDRQGQVKALGNLGAFYGTSGEARRAVAFNEQSLAIAREIGDRRGEGKALGNLGIAYAALDEVRRAISFDEQSLTIAREVGDRRREAAALGNLGNSYAMLGDTKRAIALYNQTLAIGREVGDRWSVARASWNLGWMFEKKGELAQAAELMQALVDFERESQHSDAGLHSDIVAAVRARDTAEWAAAVRKPRPSSG